MKFYLTLSLFTLSLVSFAQPTLNQSNMRPEQSTIMNFNSSAAEVDNVAGEDITWDNSNLFGTPEGSYTVVNPLWTPFSKDFNMCNWALENPLTTVFYDTADSAMVYYGGVEGSDVVFYNDPQVYLSFPFTDGDTHTDEFGATFSIEGVTYTRTGSMTATGNGWGSVILPTGTYNNVLRCDMTESISDESVVINYTLDLTYTTFVSPEVGFWVLQYGEIVYSDDQGNDQVIPYTQYLQNIDLVVSENPSRSEDLTVYPNQTQDFITLSNPRLGQVYQIFGMEGQLILAGLVDGQPINVSGIAAGTYTINIIEKHNIQSTLFIKK